MRLRPAGTIRRPHHRSADPGRNTTTALLALIYELLDAHADTAELATGDATETEWRNHLMYLMDLQRLGRVALARTDSARG